MIPNYIYKYIIEILINFYFKKNSNNEIILISLVSKNWFNLVSSILKNKLNIENYNLFKKYINHTANKNSFKFIDRPTSNFINFYDNSDWEKEYEALENKQEFERIRVSLNYSQIKDSNYINNLPSNFEIDLRLAPNSISDIDSIDINKHKINTIEIDGSMMNNNLMESIFKKIARLRPRIISVPMNNLHHFHHHSDHSSLFELDSLEELDISYQDHVEPYSISKLNNRTTKLKSLTISISFHQIIFLLNGTDGVEDSQTNSCSNRGEIIHKNTIKQDWDNMIKVLSENKTIEKLEIRGIDCYKRDGHIDKQDTSYINQSLKYLFETNTTIKYLILENLNFINSSDLINGIGNSKSIEKLSLEKINYLNQDSQISLDGLANNTVIKKLTLMNLAFESTRDFFKNVLSKNKTIKDLKFGLNRTELSKLSNMLNENYQNINLFSLNIASYYLRSIYIDNRARALEAMENESIEIDNFSKQLLNFQVNQICCSGYSKKFKILYNNILG